MIVETIAHRPMEEFMYLTEDEALYLIQQLAEQVHAIRFNSTSRHSITLHKDCDIRVNVFVKTQEEME